MNEQKQTMAGPWDGAEVISVHTRAQALEDGVLVDVTDWAREAGFKFPVAVTRRVWDVLSLRPRVRTWSGGRGICSPSCSTPSGARQETTRSISRRCSRESRARDRSRPRCGVNVLPATKGEPVITMMLRGED